ncbi:uncharacterized protein [Miscanthus floridulus]|uniref:uncharacterized protein isoform X2 n=1 Tax=Miscanthus floridulus TaxID=154761 RepID=UPI00345ACF43
MTHQDPCMDKRRMGKGLDRISRGLNNKIKVHIAQGNKRPEAPMEAAKLASEASIFIRDHIRIFTRWKDYEDDAVKELLDDYMGKIGMQFDIDMKSQPVKDACSDILKKGQRNMRYMLKKKYFNDVPANQKQTKYKDAPPTAIDLFKETHCSSKTGFSEDAQNAIVLCGVASILELVFKYFGVAATICARSWCSSILEWQQVSENCCMMT